MSAFLLPPRFQFRWAFPVRQLPKAGKSVATWPLPDACRLPRLDEFDGICSWASVFAGWNEGGLGIAVEVLGKSEPPLADLNQLDSGDWLQLWIDTRCTQTVHRATRFCHQFLILPAAGRAKPRKPMLLQRPLAQAREATGAVELEHVEIETQLLDGGYRTDIWFPHDSLHGFDPANHPRLGFYATVNDAEGRQQPLTVDSEFPYDFDPSVWQTLELTQEPAVTT